MTDEAVILKYIANLCAAVRLPVLVVILEGGFPVHDHFSLIEGIHTADNIQQS